MELKESLEKIVGFNNVADDDFEIEAYTKNWGCPTVPRRPIIIVRPINKEQIIEIVNLANQKKVPIAPFGGKSNCIDAWPENVIAIDMTSMNKLIEVNEESLTVTAEAGMHWGELFYKLAKRGWTPGFRIHSLGTATLGGSVALCANGATGARYGLLGEQIISLQVILPNGDIINTGSSANPKAQKFQRYSYVSDLTGLFIGSNGIFGIITEVTLKIYPLPETYSYYGYQYETMEAAARTVYEIQKRSFPHGGLPVESMYLKLGEKSLKMRNPPIYAEGIIFPLVLAGRRDEVEFYGEKLEEICLKEGGPIKNIDLSIDPLKAWPKRKDGNYGLMMVSFCSNIPTLQVPKVGREFFKLYKEFEAEKYKIYPNLGFGGHACNQCDITFSAGLSFDYRFTETRQKTRELIEKYYELGMDLGLAPHYIGLLRQNVIMPKLGHTYELLRTIKKTLDPNNIMVPGLLVLPESRGEGKDD